MEPFLVIIALSDGGLIHVPGVTGDPMHGVGVAITIGQRKGEKERKIE